MRSPIDAHLPPFRGKTVRATGKPEGGMVRGFRLQDEMLGTAPRTEIELAPVG